MVEQIRELFKNNQTGKYYLARSNIESFLKGACLEIYQNEDGSWDMPFLKTMVEYYLQDTLDFNGYWSDNVPEPIYME